MTWCIKSMEYASLPQKPNNSVVRHLCHVPIVHVAAVAAFGAAGASSRTVTSRTQRIRHVLDELVYCGRGCRSFPQRRSSARVRVGVWWTPLRLHGRVRDLTARRTGTRRTVQIQTKCAHRIYRFQRRGSETTSRGVGQTVPR